MHLRTFFSILLGAVCIALLLWFGAYAYRNIILVSARPVPTAVEQPAAMTAFLVAWPDFIVDGSNLGKVEIWAAPAGPGALEGVYQLLGTAGLQTGSEPLLQIWTLPIPEEPVQAVEIFAKGFDLKGEFVGQMSLPYLGATQIYNAVWAGPRVTAPAADTQRHFSFVLAVGAKAAAGGLSVRLLEIESDSRCPRTAVCIWAGEVKARVQLTAGERDETVSLHSMSAPAIFGNYQISITNVVPLRAGAPPAQEDYRVTFSVEKI